MSRIILIGTSIAALGAAMAFAVMSFLDTADIDMTLHGWIAMGLAAFFTLALGGGLMWLSFRSHRTGHDERAHYDPID